MGLVGNLQISCPDLSCGSAARVVICAAHVISCGNVYHSMQDMLLDFLRSLIMIGGQGLDIFYKQCFTRILTDQLAVRLYIGGCRFMFTQFILNMVSFTR